MVRRHPRFPLRTYKVSRIYDLNEDTRNRIPYYFIAKIMAESRNFLKVLVDPKDAQLDVVAVHGLNYTDRKDHAERTWTASNGKMWIRDFLPAQLPNARIFLFGYNANVVFEASTAGVDGQATNLLNRLRAKRQGVATDRPIMFICYSLGGIVVKRALVDAKLDQTYENIRKSCCGIVFFGTPHRGGNFACFGSFPENAFIEVLKKNSLFSDDVAEDFRHQLGDRWVVSFYETLPLGGQGVIVDQKSATLGLPGMVERQLGLDTNHEDLCKFRDCDGHDYEQVKDNIQEMAEYIMTRCSPEDCKKKRPEILKWLSTITVEDHHSFVSSGRLAGTGDWLFEKPEFIEWRKSKSSSILWLHGIAGAGKSKLISLVIDQFRRTMGGPNALAYFYCNYKEADRRDPEYILRAIVKQLCTIEPELPLPRLVTTLYKSRESKGFQSGPLTLDESKTLILGLSAGFVQTIICIDALDECNENTREKLLHALQHILKSSNLRSSTGSIKIFVTSRDDDDIVLELGGIPNVYIRSSDNTSDINYFVESEIERCIRERKILRGSVGLELKTQIIKTLTDGSDGMFLWAHLQILSICREASAADVEEALTRLPKGLMETFSRILATIKSQSVNKSTLAQKVLSIILYAQRPLSPNEIIDALYIKPRQMEWKGNNGLTEMAIIAACKNLVVIDRELGVLRFAHLSIQDFLRGQFEPSHGHTQLAEICLTLLCWPNYGNEYQEVRTGEPAPFAAYSIQNWAAHSRLSDNCRDSTALEERPLARLQKEFLRPCLAFERWCGAQSSGAGERLETQDLESSTARFIPPLLVACHFGLLDICQYLLSTKADRGVLHWKRKTSLHYAAKQGHEQIVEQLLKKMTAWKVGILKTKRIIAHRSLSHWVNLKDDEGQTPLLWAAQEGHEGVVKQLLQVVGVDAGCKDSQGWTPLLFAALRGHEGVVRQLLQVGVDANCKNDEGWTPLFFAANEGHEGVVMQFLQVAGVEVNCRDNEGRTPLLFAASKGYEAVVRQLLNVKGVDVNCKDSLGWTPLLFAASEGHEGVVRQLLQVVEVEVNCKDKDNSTPLYSAVSRGHEGVVKQLLQVARVDVNCKDDIGRTPLHSAVLGGHEEMVKQLLQAAGVDVNCKIHNGRTSLHFAASRGHEGVVKQLLQVAGVDVNCKDNSDWTPLHFAASGGHEGVVKKLLQVAGMDLNYRNRLNYTPLRLAQIEKHTGITKLLNDAGASM